ncbi:MAG TPA: cysteine synthase family protein [Mycobacteriales bacterium]|nr:cysteine synthase family protein [Mycobacteriales bacterium]
MRGGGSGGIGGIGRTPLLQIALPDGTPGALMAKAEMLQPGGSIKDRAALACIEHALATDALEAKQPVVEMTSGNMGAGLAVVCGVLGHPFTAYMSAGNSPRRADMMRALGATVVLVEQVDGVPGQVTGADIAAAEEQARAGARQLGAYYVDQFNNPGSLRAHELGTAAEIWQQTSGGVDAFIACVGSGGTLIGCGRGLKSRKAHLQVVAVEPASARILAEGSVRDPRHTLQGSGYGIVPPLWDASVVDDFLGVDDDTGSTTREWLGRSCGLHVGFTAAANVAASIEWLGQQGRDDLTVVTVLCDTGLKYLND